ncbi:hypothetical protein [Marasmitruncus massiliensis]|uniref:hypothetical protein n=1 Tax=Marasmitruncus massiliensis TaxID=1944642 RepID=UPI000C7B10F9|nr:hypothetical protein [Marasmitruncus massiliensis]
MEQKNCVAFLDLLGFSHLVETDIRLASENLDYFNHIIQTKIVDDKIQPWQKEAGELQQFVRNSGVTAIENLISVSDSIIISGSDCDNFIIQMCNLISSMLIQSGEPFNKPFTDINTVSYEYDNNFETHTTSKLSKSAFPLLFRGGFVIGEKDDVEFFDNLKIQDGCVSNKSGNVFGKSYVEAVKLESSGKGPRIFCKKNITNNLSSEFAEIVVPTEISGICEIIWTFYAFESMENCSNKQENLKRCLTKTIFPIAENLYQYYLIKSPSVAEHYYQLIVLIIKGARLYCIKNNICQNDIEKYCKNIFEEMGSDI